jgi:hypothetical protein
MGGGGLCGRLKDSLHGMSGSSVRPANDGLRPDAGLACRDDVRLIRSSRLAEDWKTR